MPKIGVLITNTGTPDAPTPSAVRRYLREFLSDRRVVQIPRLVWLPILYGLILTTRPQKSALLYKKIWTAEGSPMRVIMQKIVNKLSAQGIETEIGMNYGSPSIQHGMEALHAKNVDTIIVLPLFPQYSHTTTASSMDRVTAAIRKWKTKPEIKLVHDYADNQQYIHALAASVRASWDINGIPQHLLISFHGIPERFVAGGDPYQSQCEQTATLLAQALGLPNDKWTLCYQSQFGYDKWLKPATQDLLADLPQRDIREISIICPGFSVDCLETLEEIAIRYQAIFLQAGGKSLSYIPALNDSVAHIDALAAIIANKS